MTHFHAGGISMFRSTAIRHEHGEPVIDDAGFRDYTPTRNVEMPAYR
jgi:hypothetical protein